MTGETGNVIIICFHCVCKMRTNATFQDIKTVDVEHDKFKLWRWTGIWYHSRQWHREVFFLNECGFQWRILNKRQNFFWSGIPILFIICSFKSLQNRQVFRAFDWLKLDWSSIAIFAYIVFRFYSNIKNVVSQTWRIFRACILKFKYKIHLKRTMVLYKPYTFCYIIYKGI